MPCHTCFILKKNCRMIRYTAFCRKHDQRTPDKPSSTKTSRSSNEIYDQVDDNSGNQELWKVSKLTLY